MHDLLYEVRDGIGSIKLNRPQRKNALTLEMIDGLAAVLAAARTDPTVRVVVLSGTGGSFCSGLDLDALGLVDGRLMEPPLHYKRLLTERIHRIAFAFEDLDKPTIAAIDGSAVGAGLDIALMCDLRVATTAARMAETYIRLGLVPGAGGCYFLPKIVGRAKAMELLLTGRTVDGDEAARIGLVNRVVADDEFADAIDALTSAITSAPPVSVSLIKRATLQSETSDLRTALDLISSHMAVVASTRDTGEALTARQERRTPRFEGR
jgi:enoyl-CoA hydratase/carnithine racemase